MPPVIALFLAAAISVSLARRDSGPWTHPAIGSDTLDRSPHTQRMIEANGARLHLLDWGGSGRLLVFLPGYGLSAHVFDDLAPAFTDRFHVVALTPRGFPPSSAPDSGYSIIQLTEDLRAVLDSLGVQQAVLAGHSISGAVITQFGMWYPQRLTAAVYLGAAFDFGPAFRRGHRPGRPIPQDTTSVAYRAWQGRFSDSLLAPGILAAVRVEDKVWQIDSTDAARRKRLVASLTTEVRSRPHEPWRVSAPLLALSAEASFDRLFGWLTPDSARWGAAQMFYREVMQESRAERERLATRKPNATIIALESGHMVFLEARDEVVRAMRAFLERSTSAKEAPEDTPARTTPKIEDLLRQLPATSRTGGAFIDVNGARLFYQSAGTGSVVVLLHGGNLDHRMWDQQFQAFARFHRVIRYDGRGGGRSSPADVPFAAHEDLFALLTALKVQRASLVGHSGGGRVAIDFALAHPTMVDRLVLAAPGLSGWQFIHRDTSWFPEGRLARDRGDGTGIALLWLKNDFMKAAMERPALAARLRDMARLNGPDWMGLLKHGDLERLASPPALHRTDQLRAPTLLIVGTRDNPDIMGIADTLTASVVGIRRVSFEGAGHMVNMEQADRFTEIVLQFLKP